jgi:hypothetical protein
MSSVNKVQADIDEMMHPHSGRVHHRLSMLLAFSVIDRQLLAPLASGESL